jgi:HEAT repeat protein
MRWVPFLLVVISAAGCAKARPTLAGGKPVTYWVAAVHHTDAKVRKQAVFRLGNVGATDEAVLPALIAALKDAEAAVRCEAIIALLKCGPAAQAAASPLAEAKRNDRDANVRRYAARALDKLPGSN